MEQKLEEISKKDSEQAKEYFEFIKASVANESYFKDALNWYFFRYVTPICDRTLLIFGSIIAAIVLYFLVQMIQNAFPLIVREPLFLRSKDQSRYFPNLIALKPKKNSKGYDPAIKTVDEAILKYLLLVYVKDREGYDFSKAKIEDVNDKFNRIRNTSSSSEYQIFQLVMSKDNPNSPINDFGQSIAKEIIAESVSFIREDPKNLTQKALLYLSNKIPTEAEVRFVAVKRNFDPYGEQRDEQERYLAKIKFSFNGASKNDKETNLGFVVNEYKLFKIR